MSHGQRSGSQGRRRGSAGDSHRLCRATIGNAKSRTGRNAELRGISPTKSQTGDLQLEITRFAN